MTKERIAGIDLKSLPTNPSPPDMWQEKASCHGIDPDVFFPTSEEEAGPALAYCGACGIRDDVPRLGAEERRALRGLGRSDRAAAPPGRPLRRLRTRWSPASAGAHTGGPMTESTVRATAPLRISFVGGGTDFPHYYERHGGAVLSATIDHCAHVDAHSSRRSPGHDPIAGPRPPGRVPPRGGPGLRRRDGPRQGGDRRGSASASGARRRHRVGRAARERARRIDRARHRLRRRARRAARSAAVDLRGREARVRDRARGPRDRRGWQDQYAAAFGGFNLLEFSADGVTVTPLMLGSESALSELRSAPPPVLHGPRPHRPRPDRHADPHVRRGARGDDRRHEAAARDGVRDARRDRGRRPARRSAVLLRRRTRARSA